MWDFERVLAWLREVAHPCAPPIGVGEFEVLYASRVEVVVWYSPAREGHRAGEVAIPCRRLAAAWEALRAGRVLDEAALTELGEGMGGGRWLLAVLALVPGTQVEAGILSPQPSPRARGKGARAARGSADVMDVADVARARKRRVAADAEDGGARRVRGTGTRGKAKRGKATPQAEGEQPAGRDGDRERRSRGGAATPATASAQARGTRVNGTTKPTKAARGARG